MPAVTAYFSDFGTASARTLAARVTASAKKMSAETSAMASASCQRNPMFVTTVYVKNALIPMPGVKMIGASAQSAISRHPIAEANIVANTLSSAGIPPSARISGLTMMMYEMAKNDVRPAITSTRLLCTLSELILHSPFQFSSIIPNVPSEKRAYDFSTMFFSLKWEETVLRGESS